MYNYLYFHKKILGKLILHLPPPAPDMLKFAFHNRLLKQDKTGWEAT